MTDILRQAGVRTIYDKAVDKRTARKRVLARLLWELVTEGSAVMSDGETELRLDPGDWVGLVKWLYTHLDGPPVERKEITGADGNNIVLTVIYDEK